MSNPGSLEAMKLQQQQMTQQPMPKGVMLGMLFSLLVMMVIMIWRTEIGGALNVVFQVFDFGGKKPVLTLVIAGLIMITISTIVRTLLTDTIKVARSQHVSKEFSAELRQARADNNLYKMKKLSEQQVQMNMANMDTMSQTMKSMPITMVTILPIYAWVFYFISNTVPEDMLTISMPWDFLNLNSNLAGFMPVWIVIYTLISLPIGQLENKVMQFFLLGRRLRELDREVTRESGKA